MKVEEITYGKSFELPGFWEKIGIKIQVEENDLPNTVLDTAKNIVEKWHRERNPDLYPDDNKKKIPVIDAKKDEQIDKEFKLLKLILEKYEFREDAQAYLDTTEWRLAVEAKAIVNSKPIKNK